MLDDIILDLETDQEKAALIAGDIDQSYFGPDDDRAKHYLFDRTRIEFDILFDYIAQMGNKLNDVRKMLREWREPCGEEGGVSCQSK